ncbi:MAG: hypothetical protein J6Y78_02755 [Paludibacteraceae bacterium]|nr:hypothetical protein [Paludibacteraceae bacterium]
MKKLLSIAAIAFSALSVCAQEYTEAQLKRMDRERIVPSKVITKSGDTLVGYLRIMKVPTAKDLGYYPPEEHVNVIVTAPEVEFSCKIKFLSEADFNGEKVKNSMYKTYSPKLINGYIYDYKGQNLIFRTVNMKCGNFTYNGETFAKYVKDLPNGEIFYEYYYPFNVNFGTPTYEEVEPFTHSHYAVYLPSTGRTVLVADQKPEEFYATRCPQIVERWKNNEYTDVTGKKESKLNKLAKLASKIDQGLKDEARKKAFDDYLKTCIEK